MPIGTGRDVMTTPSEPSLTRPEPLQRQVARNLRNAIEAGTLRHGQVLPSTRELAEQWDTSVFTVNEAMKILMGEGIVVSKSRSKRVVHKPDQDGGRQLVLTRPHAILIGGYAGSGKSEFGRILTRQTKWPLLDKDTLTRPVVETALELLDLSPNDRESDAYLSRIRPREYEALMAATYENIDCGASAIVAAPFIREFHDDAWIERTRAALSGRGADVTFVWVVCDADTMQMYIRHRGAARDAAKLAKWSTYLSGIDIDFRPNTPHQVVENSASSAPLQTQAVNLVNEVMTRPSS
jgi:DNA-binding transcriptional regulator YhcF (GntR family)/predicted kinase